MQQSVESGARGGRVRDPSDGRVDEVLVVGVPVDPAPDERAPRHHLPGAVGADGVERAPRQGTTPTPCPSKASSTSVWVNTMRSSASLVRREAGQLAVHPGLVALLGLVVGHLHVCHVPTLRRTGHTPGHSRCIDSVASDQLAGLVGGVEVDDGVDHPVVVRPRGRAGSAGPSRSGPRPRCAAAPARGRRRRVRPCRARRSTPRGLVPAATGSSRPRRAGRCGRRRPAPGPSARRGRRGRPARPGATSRCGSSPGTPGPASRSAAARPAPGSRRARRRAADGLRVGERLPLVEQRRVGLADRLPQPLDRSSSSGVRCDSGTVWRSVR